MKLNLLRERLIVLDGLIKFIESTGVSAICLKTVQELVSKIKNDRAKLVSEILIELKETEFENE